jgi:hypothetical protein
MSWTEFVLQWTASQVMDWTGAPKRTVYDWRNGATPPAWLMPILMDHIARESKRHNKTPHRTDASGKVSRRSGV